jgi:DNA-directed RNA polymerase specialized sigma24 family protein
MAKLSADDRQAIFMRIEQQYDFQTIGEITGKSYDAARMTVHRALLRLAKEMRDESR